MLKIIILGPQIFDSARQKTFPGKQHTETVRQQSAKSTQSYLKDI